MNGTVRYWRNLGNGRFDLPRPMNARRQQGHLHRQVCNHRCNGDGRTDLLVTTETIAGYYPLKFGGPGTAAHFTAFNRFPSFDLKDPEVHMVDPGRRRRDWTQFAREIVRMFLQRSTEGCWNETRQIERRVGL